MMEKVYFVKKQSMISLSKAHTRILVLKHQKFIFKFILVSKYDKKLQIAINYADS